MGLWGKFLFHSRTQADCSIKVSSEQALLYSTSVSCARLERMYYSHVGLRNSQSKLARNISVLLTFNIGASSRLSECLSFDHLVGST